MTSDGIGLLLLDAIVGGLVQTRSEVSLLLASTLWGQSCRNQGMVEQAKQLTQSAIEKLASKGLIRWKAQQPLQIMPTATAVIEPSEEKAADKGGGGDAGVDAEGAAEQEDTVAAAAAKPPAAAEVEYVWVPTPAGAAVTAATSMLGFGSSGSSKNTLLDDVQSIASELDRVRRRGIYFESSLHVLYLCVSANAARQYALSGLTGKDSVYPTLDVERFMRLAWPSSHRSGNAPSPATSHLSALIEQLGVTGDIDFIVENESANDAVRRVLEMLQSAFMLPQFIKKHQKALEVIGRVWLASLVADSIDGVDVSHLQRSYGSSLDVGAITEVRDAAATRASAIYRFCKERQRTWEKQLHQSHEQQQQQIAAAAAGGGDGGGQQPPPSRGAGTGQLWCDEDHGSWWMATVIFTRIKSRLWWGVKEELIELFNPKIDSMTVEYARALFTKGYRTLSDVANSEPTKVCQALQMAARSASGATGASKRLLIRAAKALCEEARRAESEKSEEEFERRNAAMAIANIRTHQQQQQTRPQARGKGGGRAGRGGGRGGSSVSIKKGRGKGVAGRGGGKGKGRGGGGRGSGRKRSDTSANAPAMQRPPDAENSNGNQPTAGGTSSAAPPPSAASLPPKLSARPPLLMAQRAAAAAAGGGQQAAVHLPSLLPIKRSRPEQEEGGMAPPQPQQPPRQSFAERRLRSLYVNDAHRAAVSRYTHLMRIGAPLHEQLDAKDAAERWRFEKRGFGGGGGGTKVGGAWWQEEAVDDGDEEERRKRQRRSALDAPWMQDSDVGMHSDSTASGDGGSVPFGRPVRAGAAAAANTAAAAAADPEEGAMSYWKVYRRVNVDVAQRRLSGASSVSLDEDAAAPSDGSMIPLDMFRKAWLSQARFAFNLHVERSRTRGGRKQGGGPQAEMVYNRPLAPPYRDWHIIGVSVCWELCTRCIPGQEMIDRPTVYYMPLVDEEAMMSVDEAPEGEASGDASVTAPPGRKRLSLGREAPMHAEVWGVLQSALDGAHSLKVADQSKMQAAILLDYGIRIAGRLYDPRIAAWMNCPDQTTDQISTRRLSEQYFPLLERSLEAAHNVHGRLDDDSGERMLSVRDECCRCCFRCLSLMVRLDDLLITEKSFPRAAIEQEMRLSVVLARMELHGFPIRPTNLLRSRMDIRHKRNAIEAEVERLTPGLGFRCGCSAKEVCRVLFDELKLGESDVRRYRRKRPQPKGKTKKGAAAGTSRKPRALLCIWETSTNALQLLTSLHPLPGLIIEYRKLTAMIRDSHKALYAMRQHETLHTAQHAAANGVSISRRRLC